MHHNTINMNYQSQAMQDRFAANILGFKRNGFYLDIGSCHAVSTNNSFCFEQLGWKGICIEYDEHHNESYRQRNCIYINQDATKIDYEKLLNENNAPSTIDFLSLDIDALSTSVLEMLPLDKFKFSAICIEHDYYIHEGKYRDRQRKILADAGYILLCADVLVPISHDTKPDCSFEDWWIHSSFNYPAIESIRCSFMYPSQIIEKFK